MILLWIPRATRLPNTGVWLIPANKLLHSSSPEYTVLMVTAPTRTCQRESSPPVMEGRLSHQTRRQGGHLLESVENHFTTKSSGNLSMLLTKD